MHHSPPQPHSIWPQSCGAQLPQQPAQPQPLSLHRAGSNRGQTPCTAPPAPKTPNTHGTDPVSSLPLPSLLPISPVLGSGIAAAMGAQPEQGGMGEGFFFFSLSLCFILPPSRLFWQSQTPDVRSASWEVLLAPLGAEGRGKARELEPGVLSHCRTWRIPQLAAGTFPSSLLAICSKKTLSEPHHHSGYNTASSC